VCNGGGSGGSDMVWQRDDDDENEDGKVAKHDGNQLEKMKK
jgi:hypothetical protein